MPTKCTVSRLRYTEPFFKRLIIIRSRDQLFWATIIVLGLLLIAYMFAPDKRHMAVAIIVGGVAGMLPSFSLALTAQFTVTGQQPAVWRFLDARLDVPAFERHVEPNGWLAFRYRGSKWKAWSITHCKLRKTPSGIEVQGTRALLRRLRRMVIKHIATL